MKRQDLRAPHSEGAIALMAVLILMAAALVIATGLALRGIGSLQAVDATRQGEEAFAGADACLAEGLVRLRNDSAYTGGTLSVGSATCTVSVTDDGGGQRTLRTSGVRRQSTRRVQGTAQVGSVVLSGRTVGTLSLTSWQETTE